MKHTGQSAGKPRRSRSAPRDGRSRRRVLDEATVPLWPANGNPFRRVPGLGDVVCAGFATGKNPVWHGPGRLVQWQSHGRAFSWREPHRKVAVAERIVHEPHGPRIPVEPAEERVLAGLELRAVHDRRGRPSNRRAPHRSRQEAVLAQLTARHGLGDGALQHGTNLKPRERQTESRGARSGGPAGHGQSHEATGSRTQSAR